MSGRDHTGACLCGAVRYRVRGTLRPVVTCHCNQCRRWSGHVVAATAAARAGLEIEDRAALRWFDSSPGVRRGFCGRCGSSLFWDQPGAARVSIMAGTLDPPTGLRTRSHIFVAAKGDYYEIADRVPCFAGDEDERAPPASGA